MLNNNYIIYRLKSEDSFAHLAHKFNLSEDDLISFHNQNCNNNSQIYFKDISGLNEIYIPINYKTSEEIEKLLLSERPNSVLDSDFYKEKYKIYEIVTNDNESTDLDYDLSLVFGKIDNENVVTIHRDQLNKKGKQLSNKMQELALWSSQSLFPISFLLDQKNTPIKIKDYDSLKNAFQQNRTKIEDFYKGNFVQNYLDLFYDQLSNEEKICQKIISSALFKSLFPNIELFRKTTSFCISFPILSIQKPVLFSCEVTYDHQEENVVYTIIKGKSIENELLKDTISEHDSQHNTILNSMKSELLLVYITDKKDKKLQKCKLALKTYHHGAVYSSYQLIIE